MQMATLNVSEDQAREALKNYRKDVRGTLAPNEYRNIRRGYQRVLKGQPLIELSRVITAGGEDDGNRPRLAVLRADQTECHMVRYTDGSIIFGSSGSWNEARSSGRVALRAGTLTRICETVRARSIVPLIPPQHLPKGHLSRYHILWEATWTDVPADPALLQHIGGDLYAVLAVWDLTDLERAVLRGRSNA